MATRTERPERLGPESIEVQATIPVLQRLTEREFASELADWVMDPEPSEVLKAAFRSPALVTRSAAATKYLIANANTTIRYAEGESNKSKARRAARFRDAIGLERRLLETILAGWRAQQKGVLPNAPNPRQRAFEDLARKYPEDYLRFVRNHEAERTRERARLKAERKAAHRSRVA